MDRKNSVERQKRKKSVVTGNACVSAKVILVSRRSVFMSTLRQVLGLLFDYTRDFNPLKHVVGVIQGYRALIY